VKKGNNTRTGVLHRGQGSSLLAHKSEEKGEEGGRSEAGTVETGKTYLLDLNETQQSLLELTI
jgi:hypothetical protein